MKLAPVACALFYAISMTITIYTSDKDSVYFYSRDKLVLNGHFEGSIEFHNSGFATLHSVWPSISYTSDASLAVNEKSDILPKEFALHDNYPNPFNPTTTIRFDLPKSSDVSVLIFNVLGQKIKTIEKYQMNPGYPVSYTHLTLPTSDLV